MGKNCLLSLLLINFKFKYSKATKNFQAFPENLIFIHVTSGIDIFLECAVC